MKQALPILGVISLSLVLVGCNLLTPATNTNSTAEPATPTAALVDESNPVLGEGEEMAEATPEALVDTDTDYIIDMENFTFNPSKLTMKAGTTIKIKLNNVEGNHDLKIDELKVNSKILKAGESQTFEITAPLTSAGKSYEFYCSVGQHRQMGMVGMLTVTE